MDPVQGPYVQAALIMGVIVGRTCTNNRSPVVEHIPIVPIHVFLCFASIPQRSSMIRVDYKVNCVQHRAY